jgi:hypothetical protein
VRYLDFGDDKKSEDVQKKSMRTVNKDCKVPIVTSECL